MVASPPVNPGLSKAVVGLSLQCGPWLVPRVLDQLSQSDVVRTSGHMGEGPPQCGGGGCPPPQRLVNGVRSHLPGEVDGARCGMLNAQSPDAHDQLRVGGGLGQAGSGNPTDGASTGVGEDVITTDIRPPREPCRCPGCKDGVRIPVPHGQHQCMEAALRRIRPGQQGDERSLLDRSVDAACEFGMAASAEHPVFGEGRVKICVHTHHCGRQRGMAAMTLCALVDNPSDEKLRLDR